jgi:hypothetical protein
LIALALAGTGLGTAFATVGIGKSPAPDAERALTRTIVRQRVAEGLPAQPPAATPPPGAGAKAEPAITRESILAAVDSFEAEMKELISQVEDMKKKAYASKDIIRLTYLTAKHDEMKVVESMIAPVIASIRAPGVELFVMQGKLMSIRQGVERLRQSAADASAAQGDGMDTGVFTIDPSNSGAGDNNDGLSDLPPPGNAIERDYTRPVNASPYR